jgi:hypothetical protein
MVRKKYGMGRKHKSLDTKFPTKRRTTLSKLRTSTKKGKAKIDREAAAAAKNSSNRMIDNDPTSPATSASVLQQAPGKSKPTLKDETMC